jgi:hypothetical protein
MVLAYCVVYGAACATKHFGRYGALMLGRILGGAATSILFSVFEAWIVSEAGRNRLGSAALARTLSLAQLGNSALAVAAGVVAQAAADALPLSRVANGGADGWMGALRFSYGGYCTPFDLSAALLALCAVAAARLWRENFGESRRRRESVLDAATWRRALGDVAGDAKVALCGIVSACFESAMYAFVFWWTPTLKALWRPEASESAAASEPPYGTIFATFMVCCMGGSVVFGWTASGRATSGALRRCGARAEWTMAAVVALAAAALAVPAFATSDVGQTPAPTFDAFLVFEACVGFYFPAMGTMKARIVRDASRAAVYNIFRVPLNLIVVVVLLSSIQGRTHRFTVCAGLLAVAAASQVALACVVAHESLAAADKKRHVGEGGSAAAVVTRRAVARDAPGAPSTGCARSKLSLNSARDSGDPCPALEAGAEREAALTEPLLQP